MENLKRMKSEKEKYFIRLWKKRIAQEKGYTESVAEKIALRVKALAEHMLYGHAVIAFYKQNGAFQLATGTLVPYYREFKQSFDMERVHGTFVYWDEEAQGWRTFQIENFLEWKAIV